MTSKLATPLVALLLFSSASPSFGQTLSERIGRETPAALAVAARERGNAVRGAIVFTGNDLACTGCHAVGADDRVGPDLTRLGDDVTDEHLVEALLTPSKTIRKGYESVSVITTDGKQVIGRVLERADERIVLRETTGDRRRRTIEASDIEAVVPSTKSSMPDNLVDKLKDRDQFLDLVRYTMQLRSTPAGVAHVHPPGGGTISADLRGLVLLKEYQCVACHRDDATVTDLTVKTAPDLTWSSGRVDPRHVERFLLDPHGTKPGTTMPSILHRLPADERETAAGDLTHYVASLSERIFERQPIDPDAAERGRETFHSVGCVACHSPRDEAGKETLAEDSVPLGPIAEKFNVTGLVTFLENPHGVRPGGRMPNMQLTHWEAIDVANHLLAPSADVATTPFVVDSDRAARGKERFGQLGCASCHSPQSVGEPTSVALSRARPDRGCLSEDTGPWPRFDLTEDERTSIRDALARKPGVLTDEQRIDVTLTAFRCVNCHQRGTLGGVTDARNPHFRTTNPNLGPQGRLPPTLTNVGAKLNPKWMRQVLVEGRSIRPYVRTRMPRFGTANIEHLVELFERTDELPPIEFGKVDDEKAMRNAGHEMAGTGGLNCIACHTFQLKQAANMPAVDLTEMAERLRKPWFFHYMRDPQRLSRNTVMPSFWPAGRAMRPDILEGDTTRQIEALWVYLLDGRQARTPRGLIREPIELLATDDEAVMLRRSYPNIGKRGIGVGYPKEVNLAYDAEQMRLATIWRGKFADPAGVWLSQGHGRVRPLGTDLVNFTAGPDVDDPVSPWVVDEGRPPNHRFRGYTLDEKRRPRFRYDFGGIAVEDYPVDGVDPSSERTFLRRTVTVHTERGTKRAVFRVADGKRIVADDNGTFLVDDRLRVRIVEGPRAAIVDRDGGQRLHVPLTATTEPESVTVEYVWEEK